MVVKSSWQHRGCNLPHGRLRSPRLPRRLHETRPARRWMTAQRSGPRARSASAAPRRGRCAKTPPATGAVTETGYRAPPSSGFPLGSAIGACTGGSEPLGTRSPDAARAPEPPAQTNRGPGLAARGKYLVGPGRRATGEAATRTRNVGALAESRPQGWPESSGNRSTFPTAPLGRMCDNVAPCARLRGTRPRERHERQLVKWESTSVRDLSLHLGPADCVAFGGRFPMTNAEPGAGRAPMTRPGRRASGRVPQEPA